jgi:hypothetical protein
LSERLRKAAFLGGLFLLPGAVPLTRFQFARSLFANLETQGGLIAGAVSLTGLRGLFGGVTLDLMRRQSLLVLTPCKPAESAPTDG